MSDQGFQQHFSTDAHIRLHPKRLIAFFCHRQFFEQLLSQNCTLGTIGRIGVMAVALSLGKAGFYTSAIRAIGSDQSPLRDWRNKRMVGYHGVSSRFSR